MVKGIKPLKGKINVTPTAESLFETQVTTNSVKLQHPSKLSEMAIPNNFQFDVNQFLPINRQQIDEVNNRHVHSMSELSKKLNSSILLRDFDSLGNLLAETEMALHKVNDIEGSTPIKWIKNQIFGVKKVIIKNFHTVEESLNTIQERTNNNITKHENWIAVCDELYSENYKLYYSVIDSIKQLEKWENDCNIAVDSLPKINPDDIDAPMKAQALVDARQFIKRLNGTIDYLKRIKIVVETTAPTLRNLQAASRDSIQTARDISIMLPVVQNQFTAYLHSLDVRKFNHDNALSKNLVNNSLVTASESARNASIEAATAVNGSIIEASTLQSIISNGMQVITKVRSIEDEAVATREREAKEIEASRSAYLNLLK